jgi:hypothetical protein
MRTLIAFLLVIFNLPQAEAQINLVPNPSFEDTVYCPFGLNQIDAAVGWSNFNGSCDYYNSCANNYCNVPLARCGFQYAHSGEAMSGVVTFDKNIAAQNYREHCGIEMISILNIGSVYYFSFYFVRGDSTTNLASNNLGVKFFTSQLSLPTSVNNYSHYKIDTICIDSVNWNRLSGSFIADSAYKFLAIGNFYDDFNTDTISLYSDSRWAYYYIDDVCVTTDSLFNATWTGLQTTEPSDVKAWPNPVWDILQFSTIKPLEEVVVYDSVGRIIKKVQVNSREGRIDLKELAQGVYVAKFRSGKIISAYKFFKF